VKNTKRNKYMIMCIVFVVALITIAVSISFAYIKLNVTGDTTETKIETGTYDIETSLSSVTAFNATNMVLINEEEIEEKAESISFTVKPKNTNSKAGKFNVYLKDISISNGLIDSSFKWQILMDGKVIDSGDFSTIESKGIKSTTVNDTETMKYYDSFDLKSNIEFNGFNESSIEIRVYLLNDSTINQNNLMNGTFQGKVGIEAYI